MEQVRNKMMSIFFWFWDPVQRHYVDFSGRASRQAFWQFTIAYFSLAFIISSVEALLGTVFISIVTSFTLLLPSLAITTRRLHDTGLSGWWQLVGFVPLVGIFVLMALLARRGVDGPNDFGEPEFETRPVGTDSMAVA